ncbi:MAG: hypothetical protein ACE15F_12560, partial [bacterium]
SLKSALFDRPLLTFRPPLAAILMDFKRGVFKARKSHSSNNINRSVQIPYVYISQVHQGRSGKKSPDVGADIFSALKLPAGLSACAVHPASPASGYPAYLPHGDLSDIDPHFFDPIPHRLVTVLSLL